MGKMKFSRKVIRAKLAKMHCCIDIPPENELTDPKDTDTNTVDEKSLFLMPTPSVLISLNLDTHSLANAK